MTMTIKDTNTGDDATDRSTHAEPAHGPISAAELRQQIIDDPATRILDVRTGAEFETAHIAGSFNVPLDTLAEHDRDLAAVDHPIVLVCQSGQRAKTAQAKLNAAGKSNLRVLDGGVGAWLSDGGEVIKGAETWALDRQVRGVAGGIVLASIIASLKLPAARFVAGGVGFGLTFAALTNTCAMGNLLGRLPYNRGPECDLDAALASLSSDSPLDR